MFRNKFLAFFSLSIHLAAASHCRILIISGRLKFGPPIRQFAISLACYDRLIELAVSPVFFTVAKGEVKGTGLRTYLASLLQKWESDRLLTAIDACRRALVKKPPGIAVGWVHPPGGQFHRPWRWFKDPCNDVRFARPIGHPGDMPCLVDHRQGQGDSIRRRFRRPPYR